jgi:hypothetical protein
MLYIQFRAWSSRHQKPIRSSSSKQSVNPDEVVSPTSPNAPGSPRNFDAIDGIEVTREVSQGTSDGPGDEKASKKPVKSTDLGFTEEERDQMQALLEEVRGHLGASLLSPGKVIHSSYEADTDALGSRVPHKVLFLPSCYILMADSESGSSR